MQPRRVRGAAGKLAAIEEQSHEDFLRRVFGIVLGAHEPPADSPHPFAVPIDEGGEGEAIGTLPGGLGRKLRVGQCRQIVHHVETVSLPPTINGESGFIGHGGRW